MFDIETLRIIWWALLGILLILFAVTDGFDFGAAILLPWVARTETERRVVLNSIGPFWEGNQVWIILGAGAIFAAWPYVYAVAFSGFYLPVLLLLLTMGISRPVSFKYRSKLPNYFWRRFWDRVVFIGGLVPAFLFGLLMGNALIGVPFYFDDLLRIFYEGKIFALFNPFAFICGLTSISMLCMHGGLYLAIKTDNPVHTRAIFAARIAAIFTIIFFAIGGYFIAHYINGYHITAGADPSGYSNPLHKQVITQLGGWLTNYKDYPATMAAPILGFAGTFLVIILARLFNKIAFIASGLGITGIIATIGVSMFPFILPSSSNMTSSLVVWDASSSRLTLLLMLAAVVIFLPIIMLYTTWVYRALSGKVSNEFIEEDEHHVAY